MCGLAGIYDPKGADQDSLKKMADAISHRGPNSEGFLSMNALALRIVG
ncbi:MAG: hypothetical protein JKX84_06970 [Flavobacteriales bacterium]|nr:hypothetical protein [Flavobacteriales bacterium]